MAKTLRPERLLCSQSDIAGFSAGFRQVASAIIRTRAGRKFSDCDSALYRKQTNQRREYTEMSYPGVRPIPRSVRYKYPNGHEKRGTILDRVELRSSGKGSDYLMVIENILWQRARKPTIRFGYYRKETDDKRWRWGSQTTFHFGKDKTEKIIRKAIAKGFLNI